MALTLIKPIGGHMINNNNRTSHSNNVFVGSRQADSDSPVTEH